jgi:hypothetical protein
LAAPLAMNAQSTIAAGAAAPAASAASASGPVSRSRSANRGTGVIAKRQKANAYSAITTTQSADYYKKNPYWGPDPDWNYIGTNQGD